MMVLVGYATRHGSTAQIADRLAARLQAQLVSAEARAVQDVTDLQEYDAVILGGATYMSRWLKPAVDFARRHQAELVELSVWLFSSGPLGAERLDEDGHDIAAASQPREFDQLAELLNAREEAVFFGAYDPQAPPIGIGEHVVRHLPGAKAALTAGDFRDWAAIDAWADKIAAELRSIRGSTSAPAVSNGGTVRETSRRGPDE